MLSPTAFLGLDFGTSNANLSFVLNDPRLAGERVVQARDILFTIDPARGETSPRVPTLLASDPDDPQGRSVLTGWGCWQHLRRTSPDGRPRPQPGNPETTCRRQRCEFPGGTGSGGSSVAGPRPRC